VAEIRQGLGTMADPAELVAAMTAIGLLQRGFTAAESAAETRRVGGAELHRLQMAHALAGAAGIAGADGGRGGRRCRR
jgi:hypothetical protein